MRKWLTCGMGRNATHIWYKEAYCDCGKYKYVKKGD